jgi:hypothetical protein
VRAFGPGERPTFRSDRQQSKRIASLNVIEDLRFVLFLSLSDKRLYVAPKDLSSVKPHSKPIELKLSPAKRPIETVTLSVAPNNTVTP